VEVAVDQVSDHQSARYAATAQAGLGSAEIEALEALPDLEIQAALLSLPEAFRMAVYYADVEGFSYAEIAAIMGTSKGTVMLRLHRGRTRLRELLFVLATERGVLDRKASATASTLTPFTQLAGHAAAAAQAASTPAGGQCRLSAYSEVIFSRVRARSNSVAGRRKPLKLHGRPAC